MLEFMTPDMLLSISKDIKNVFFVSWLTKQYTSNSEELILRIRHVNHDLIAHEEFIGLHFLPGTDAHKLVPGIQDILLRINLSVENTKGQCYDRAVAMVRAKTGVTT